MKNWWRWRWLRWIRFYWYKHIRRMDIVGFFMGVPVIRTKYLEVDSEATTDIKELPLGTQAFIKDKKTGRVGRYIYFKREGDGTKRSTS